jgi:hypothetical protein
MRGSTDLLKQCPKKIFAREHYQKQPKYPLTRPKALLQMLDLPQKHTISRRDIQLPRWALAMPLKNISRHAGILEQHMVPQSFFAFNWPTRSLKICHNYTRTQQAKQEKPIRNDLVK